MRGRSPRAKKTFAQPLSHYNLPSLGLRLMATPRSELRSARPAAPSFNPTPTQKNTEGLRDLFQPPIADLKCSIEPTTNRHFQAPIFPTDTYLPKRFGIKFLSGPTFPMAGRFQPPRPNKRRCFPHPTFQLSKFPKENIGRRVTRTMWRGKNARCFTQPLIGFQRETQCPWETNAFFVLKCVFQIQGTASNWFVIKADVILHPHRGPPPSKG